MDSLSLHGRSRDPRRGLIRWAALIGVVTAAVVLSACGDSGPSIKAGQSESTSTSTASVTSTTASPPTTPTTAPTTSSSVAGQSTVITYRGLQLTVPSAWPVYEMAADPARCVRFDRHAVFLGPAGSDPSCPARVVGRTEAVQVQPLNGSTQAAEASATSPTSINGVSVLVDPNADTAGALTAVVKNLNLLVTITFGSDRATAERILQSLHAG